MSKKKAPTCVLLFSSMILFAIPTRSALADPAAADLQSPTSTSAAANSDPVTTSSVAEVAEPEPELEAPSPKRGIMGRVTDAKTGEGLIEATVKVVKGAAKPTQVLTDIDGNYALELPPGEYELRVFYELYEGRKIAGVRVAAGPATALDVALGSDASAVQEVVVEAKADTRKEAAVLKERQKAATVSDGISAEEMARAPDANASDAVKRIVSATIVDNKYVVLRGLGGRYATTLLNGVRLPSPEPDEPQAPLDLFPSSLLSNLTIAKSYDPELPGTFAGGALLIETNAYPSRFELKLKLATSGDSQTTFRDGQTYAGGGLDFLGFDDGTRSLPDAVPHDRALQPGDGLDAGAMERIAEAFNNEWSSKPSPGAPNLGLGASMGDTLNLGGMKLGYLTALNFGSKRTFKNGRVAKLTRRDGELMERESLQTQEGMQQATLGALINTGLELSSTDELGLFSLYSHQGESRVLKVGGRNESDNQTIDSTRLQFVARALSFSQLTGRHRFPGANDLTLDWQSNFSVTNRDEPDLRDITYLSSADQESRFKAGPSSGERFFSDLLDLSGGGSAGLSLPTDFAKLHAGFSVQQAARSFDARRFRYEVMPSAPNASALFLPADQIFGAENVGTTFSLRERTLPSDSYDGSLFVLGGYARADVVALDPFRVIAGLRVEHARQSLEAGSPYAITSTPPPGADRSDTDLLPSLNAVYALTPEVNLRAAYSFTLARPQFRELAPFNYFDLSRRRSVSGNPNLLETRIHNGDLRAEWFPRESAVLAASVFYKRFQDPIEVKVVDADQGDISYVNAGGAHDLGAELEARTDFGFVDPVLSGLRVGANLTLVYSRVDLSNTGAGPQTSNARPLQGQSPYVVNLNAGYRIAATGTELNLLYNLYGERISEVGVDALPDAYEQPFHRLDATVGQDLGGGFALRVAASNLINQAVRIRASGSNLDVLEYKPGVSAMASLEWVQ